MTRFDGQVAIITGAAAGIGYGIASALGSEGAHIMMVDIDRCLGERSASELASHGIDVRPAVGDVSELDVAQRATNQALKAWGRIDILVNNAGIGGVNGPIWDLPIEEMDRLYRTNLRGVFASVTRSYHACSSEAMGGS